MTKSVTFAHGGFARVGGIETFTADLALALSERRLQTELICWSGTGDRENPALARLARSGVRISRTNWRWGCRLGWPDKLMVRHQWKRFVASDLLVFGKLLHPDAHRRLLPLRKRMILITPYRPSEMWREQRPSDDLLNSLESVIVQAQAFEADLREFGYRGRVFILPLPPPEPGRVPPWPVTSTLQVGFLGRLVPDKNLDYLIASFACLRELGVTAELNIFGHGPELDALQSVANRRGLAGQVHFRGNQNHAEINRAIDSCHLFAFTSRTEGLPIGLLEILSRGRPVLGTPVGAFPEVLFKPLGSVAPLDNPKAFATAMKALAEALLRGEITPQLVQEAYGRRFPRAQVIDEYMRIFSDSASPAGACEEQVACAL